jgi:hypothetical protein
MRRSFATHLLEAGLDIRMVQEPIGHDAASATMITTHVLDRSSKKRLMVQTNGSKPTHSVFVDFDRPIPLCLWSQTVQLCLTRLNELTGQCISPLVDCTAHRSIV